MAIFFLDQFNHDATFIDRFNRSENGRFDTPIAAEPASVRAFGPLILTDFDLVYDPLPQREVWRTGYRRDAEFIIGQDLRVGTGDMRGLLVGGTIQQLSDFDSTGRETVSVFELSLPVAVMRAAYWSTDQADDVAVLDRMLAGDDLILITDFRNVPDLIRAGTGDDYVSSSGGNDQLFGQGGRDILRAGAGRDTLSGGAWDDILMGFEGPDILRGDAGRDLLAGGQGPDTLSGGVGADVFFFGSGLGRDTVTDFQDGADLLVFREARTMAELRIRAVDADTVVIGHPTGEVTVNGVSRADLTAADIRVGAAAETVIRAMERAALGANDYFAL